MSSLYASEMEKYIYFTLLYFTLLSSNLLIFCLSFTDLIPYTPSILLFWRTLGVGSTFCTGLESNQGCTGLKQSSLPLPCSGGLLQASAVCRLLHRAPPKHQGCECGALSGLFVSEMLKRSVEEEDCTQWRSGYSDSDSVCDLRISLSGRHFGGL